MAISSRGRTRSRAPTARSRRRPASDWSRVRCSLFETIRTYHPHYGSVDRVHVHVARVELTDADIDCHEGRQIVFVPPDRARELDLTMTAVLVVPAFLDSDTYSRMCP